MKNWLSIDTSMNACGVGVRLADGCIFTLTERMDRGQSERLMPMILEVLAEAGLQLSEIDAYAVTNGPGTFTGLRVGLATVRALSQVSGKPAVAVGTFDALAEGVGPRPLCVLIETKRTDYYVRLFEHGKKHEGTCMSPDDLREYLQPHWTLAGDATERAVKETGCDNPCIHLSSPEAVHIIALAEKHHVSAGAGLPEPVYLRGADVSVSRRKVARIV